MVQRDEFPERRLQNQGAGRADAERVFDEYVAAAAGEMRGPLRSVLKLARLLKDYDGAMDNGTREYADYIRASAEHMAAMLDGLRRPAAARNRTKRAGAAEETVAP